jgi:hypothetical protein
LIKFVQHVQGVVGGPSFRPPTKMKSNRTHKARNSRYEVLIMLNRPLVINPKPVSAIADIRVPFTKPDKPCLIWYISFVFS